MDGRRLAATLYQMQRALFATDPLVLTRLTDEDPPIGGDGFADGNAHSV